MNVLYVKENIPELILFEGDMLFKREDSDNYYIIVKNDITGELEEVEYISNGYCESFYGMGDDYILSSVEIQSNTSTNAFLFSYIEDNKMVELNIEIDE